MSGDGHPDADGRRLSRTPGEGPNAADRTRARLTTDALPSRFARRVTAIPASRSLRYTATDWTDALIVIASGEIELEDVSGHRSRFRSGEMLALVGLPLRALHSVGTDPATLVAINRRGGTRAGGAR